MAAPLNLDDASGLKYRIGPGIIIGSGGPARLERPRGDESWRIEVQGNEVGKSWIGGTELNRVS